MIQFGLFFLIFARLPLCTLLQIFIILCILCVGDQGATAAFFQVGKHQYPTG